MGASNSNISSGENFAGLNSRQCESHVVLNNLNKDMSAYAACATRLSPAFSRTNASEFMPYQLNESRLYSAPLLRSTRAWLRPRVGDGRSGAKPLRG